MKSLVAAVIVLSACLAARAQPPATGDLVLNARAILHKHCSACHHGGAGSKGELSVLSRAGLDRPNRPFVQLQQIIELIEDGSMPPGNRPPVPAAEREILRLWLAAAAPAYVEKYDDEYVLNTQLADARSRAAGELPFTRYVSLAHEVPSAVTPLEPRRTALKKALADLSKDGKLQPLDPAETVFRFDLRQAGWDAKPFETVTEVNEKEVRKPLRWTLFDAVLLEYPHGEYYDDIKAFATLRDAFLRPAAQIRPVAFLRGDWFADALPKLPVAAELRQTFGKPAVNTEKPPLIRVGGKRTPILPLDALSQPNVEAQPAPFKVMYFETLDAKTKMPEAKFKIGDVFIIHMHSSQDVQVEIVLTDAKGEKDILPLQRVERNAPAYIRPDGEDGFTIPDSTPVGKSYLTFYASEAKLPPAEVWKARGWADRVVHPFYGLDKPAGGIDPAKIIKRTIEIEIRK